MNIIKLTSILLLKYEKKIMTIPVMLSKRIEKWLINSEHKLYLSDLS